MNKENTNAANTEEPLLRVTRSRAKTLGTYGGMPASLKPLQDQKRVLRAKSKRAEADESRTSAATTASFQQKRRAVLKDVTNISCENAHVNVNDASEIQVKDTGSLLFPMNL